MNRIDPSVDELMWLIADQREPAAVDAFLARYPEHRAELMRRLEMVRDLVGARPESRLPAFEVRPVRRLGPPRWLNPAIACVVLASVAFGSYAVTRALAPGRAAEPQVVEPVDLTPPQLSPIVRETNDLPPQPENIGRPGPNDEPAIRQAPPPAYGRPVTLRLERVRLSEALRLISQASGVRIEVAPGTPDPEIACDYREVPALALLKDMGRTLGFTPFDQGDGAVLIIPATDPATPQPGPPATPDSGSNFAPEDASTR